MRSDNDRYQGISEELATNSLNGALWTRALAEAGGDLDKTKALYIRMRFAELKNSVDRSAISPETKRDSSDAASDLRRKIQAKLAVHKRATFYETLGVSPTCSDADIAATTNAITIDSARSGARLGADVKYAIEILRDERTRKEYDRTLWNDLCGATNYVRTEAISSADLSGATDSIFLHWWQSGKVTAIIVATVLIVLGYFAKGAFESQNIREVQKEVVGVQREAVTGQVQNQKAEIEAGAANTSKAIDRSAELQDHALAIEEEAEQRRRTELEYRANAGTQILEMQRIEQEQRLQMQREALQMQREAQQRSVERERELKEAGDRAYWSCVGDRLNRGYSSAASTESCSSYKR